MVAEGALVQLGAPILLFFMASALCAIAIGIWTLRWRRHRTSLLIRQGGGQILIGQDVPRQLARLLLVSAALALLGFAAARPQIGHHETDVQQRGIAVVLALDVSLSMGAQDQPPNRLAAAKTEIGGLLDRLQGNRVGLVLFGGDAFVRFPLTRDLNAAREIVDALEPGEGFVSAGTDVSAAIVTAQSLLASSDAATRAILVVSDGESFRGDALLAARDAASQGIRVFAAGAGTPDGATIPVLDRATSRLTAQLDSATGQPIISRADFSSLRRLADAGRGRFVLLTQPSALSNFTIDFSSLESTTFRVEMQRLPIERFQIFAGLALLLLVLDLALPLLRRSVHLRTTRPRAAALVALLLITGVLTAACASAAYSRNEDGNLLYDVGDYPEALRAYRDAQTDNPTDRRLNVNAGRALHALGEFEPAVAETSRATNTDDSLLAARAFYNIGNHRFAQDDLVGARGAYIEALILDPGDFDAKFNLELINALLFVPPPPGPTPGQGGEPNDDQSDSTPSEGDPEGAPQDPSNTEEDMGTPLDSDTNDAQGLPSANGASGADQGAGSANPSDDLIQPGPDTSSVDRRAAEAALAEALQALNRENPSRDQALAILDALRNRQPREALTVGPQAPISIPGEER
jgi:Ca-activated chloride channel family protein